MPSAKKIIALLIIIVLTMTLISAPLSASANERRHGWVQIGEEWFLYFNDVRLTGWQPVGRTWFYLDPITGVRQTGWLTLGSDRFFLDENGAMQTGWVNINGVEHEFGTNGVWIRLRAATSSTNARANEQQRQQPGTNTPPIGENNIISRPVAVTINNARAAMPQHSVSQADIIYETLVEGGITRMLAIFNNINQVGEIGSIRSARPYFIDIAASHDAVLVHGGGSPQAMQAIERRNICNIDGVFGPGLGAFYRVQQRPQIHNLFTTGTRISQTAAALGIRPSHFESFRSSPQFATDGVSSLAEQEAYYIEESEETGRISATDNISPQGTPAESGEATEVSVRFSSANTTIFRHNIENNLYYVSHHDNIWFIDGNDNSQLSVANILVLRTDISIIPEDGAGRLAITTTGRGSGYFINNGRFTEINWSRAHASAPFEYSMPDGTPLMLGWGRTYICIVPLNAEITIR
jgi:hypothetical protein